MNHFSNASSVLGSKSSFLFLNQEEFSYTKTTTSTFSLKKSSWLILFSLFLFQPAQQLFAQCSNVTDAGLLAYPESECGLSYDPALIQSVSDPTGGTGTLEIQWIETTDTSNLATYTIIAGANAVTYNPPTISQTTWYRREARRSGCSAWLSTHWLMKELRHKPNATITQKPPSPCVGVPVSWEAADAGVGATYTWDFGANATPQYAYTRIASVTYSVAGLTTPLLTVVVNGCDAVTTDYVYVVDTPTAVISPSGNLAFCAGNSPITLSANTGGGLSYQWFFNGNPIAGANNSTYTANQVGDYYVQVFNANGCSNLSGTTSLTCVCNNFTDAGVIASDEAVCGSSFDPALITSITAPSGGSGTPTYMWIFTTDSTVAAGGIGGVTLIPNTNSLTYDPGVITQTTWFRRCAQRAGCSTVVESNWVKKELKPSPVVTANGGFYCKYDNITLTSSVSSGKAPFTYSWTGALITPSNQNQQNPVLTTSANGTESGVYTLYVTDANGCVGTDTASVKVRTVTTGTFTLYLNNCGAFDPAPITHVTAPIVSNGYGNEVLEYMWQYYVPGEPSYHSFSGPVGTWSTANVTYDPPLDLPASVTSNGLLTGTVQIRRCVRIQTSNGNGCSITDGDWITIEILKQPSVTANNATICSGQTVQLVANGSVASPATISSYNWAGPNGFSYLGQTATINNVTTNDAGVYTVTVTSTQTTLQSTTATCQATGTATLTVNPSPIATALADGSNNASYCTGQVIHLTATGGGTYSWSGPNGFTSTLQNPTIANAQAAATGTYSVTVTAANGCEAVASVQVNVTTCAGASIGDFVWNDVDQDGIQDANEVGISGITVSLYRVVGGNNTLVATTITNGYGFYSFANLAAGSYVVGFALPTDFTFSPKAQTTNTADSDVNPATGLTDAITLNPGQDITTVDAGMYFTPPANSSIGDFVFLDANLNGIQDANETGVANIVVTLYNAVNVAIATTITNGNGYYSFNNLTAGTYSVGFSQPVGYVFTTQDAGTSDALDSDVNPTTGKTAPFSLAANQNKLDVDAGLVPSSSNNASIGDFVWFDLNGNGIQEAGEPGIANVTVTLYNSSNAVVATTTTNALGLYIFNNVVPGTYTLGFTIPTGYTAVPQNATNDNLDSDINSTGFTAPFVVTAGQVIDYEDAGLITTTPPSNGRIGDFVWYDTNENGIQDNGEAGVAGVTVTLYDASNSALQTTVTNINGAYLFVNLPYATYSVGFSNLPNGYTFTTQTINTANGSDANVNTGLTPQVTISSVAPQYLDLDAGIKPSSNNSGLGSIGDFVWYDTDNNGVQNVGESGVAGVVVELLNSVTNVVINTTTTTATGYYIFTNLPAGDYVVNFNLPTGYVFSAQDQGSDDALDSDANPLTGRTATISLSAGQDNLTVDAGINLGTNGTNTAVIGDFVWNDLNNNGIQDSGEPGIRGVTVTLYNSGGTAIASTVTDDNGFYLFFGVLGGSYSVGFSNYPVGFSFVTKNAIGSTNTNDSDVNPATGKTDVFTVVANQAKIDVDAGLTSTQATIGDFVWNDTNANGIQDAGETGVAGVTVTLYDNNNAPVSVAITNAAGNYFFVNVNPGTYTVGFSNIPTGATFTTPNVNTGGGNDANDSDVNPATGRTGSFTVTAGSINYTIDAGVILTPSSALFGTVWLDINKNGIQDNNEPKVQGVTVTLLDNANNTVATAISDGNGNYLFTNLVPNTYSVKFTTLPPNTGFTTPNVGGDDTIDSDADQTTGVSTTTYTSLANQTLEAADAGIVPLTSSLSGLVWNDANKDGIKNGVEPVVAGITVTLYNSLGQVVATTLTDAYGLYTFQNILPGNYYVGFSLPIGYQFTTPNVGNDADDSDVNPLTGLTNLYVVPVGVNVTDVDAGIYLTPNQTGKLGDYVWYDVNGNGAQDANESGVAGVTVTLYSVNGGIDTPIAATITNVDGYYLFLNLPAGAYKVGFSLPMNYAFTAVDAAGNDNIDSDVLADGKTDVIFLAAGQTDLSNDAGIVAGFPATGSIGDFVWNDLNNNGIQDAGEPGVANVTVNLLDDSGNIIFTTTTDVFGYYVFTNIPAGNYAIQFVAPTGYTFGVANAGSDDNVDSDANPTNGTTAYFTLPAGANLTNQDAALLQTSPAGNLRLGDYVWYDTDEDGIQDNTEVGVAGVTVVLLNGTGTPLQTTTTDLSGAYSFVNLAAGAYIVAFSNIPNGYQFTTQNVSATLGSDADPNSGLTNVINLTANNLDIDAGIIPHIVQPASSSIGDFIWNDLNNNGIQDTNEPGIGGVTVTLYAQNGTSVLAITTTNAMGYYVFNGLLAGNYVVGLSNIPAGYSISPKNQGADDDKDSDFNTGTNKTDVISLGNNQAITNVDGGLHNPNATGSIGDFVWNDVNQNGIQEVNELGVSGVTVTLIDFGTGLPIATTVTDNNGFYLFVGVPAGNYVLQFNNIPAGFSFSTPNQGGDDTKDSDVDNNGFTAPFSLTAGQVKLDVDAGLQSTRAAIGNFVWFDANRNGVQDQNENGIAGVTVNLLSNGNIVTSTITDGQGFYYFQNILAGTYTLQFTDISPLLVFTAKDATNDNEDSDVNSNGFTDAFTVVAGTIDYSHDAGLLFPQTTLIQGYVWFDTNNDGSQVPNTNEPPVPGVTVTLYDNANNVVAITVTGLDGTYQFNNVVPGTYYIGFSNLPQGASFTGQNLVNDNIDSDANPTNGLTAPFVVGGSPVQHIDAGLIVPKGSIGNYVWLDTNADGMANGSENGINGVTVQLWSAGANAIVGDSDDALLSTTTTANDASNNAGYYLFSGLNSGNYYVKFPVNATAQQVLTISNQTPNTDDNSDADNFSGNSELVVINVYGNPAERDNMTIDAGYINTTLSCPVTTSAQDTVTHKVSANVASLPASGLSLTIPQFDTSLGQLNSVEIQTKVIVKGNYTVENSTAIPASVALFNNGQATFNGTGLGAGLVATFADSQFIAVLSPSNGIANSGNDYRSGAIIPVQGTNAISASNLTPFEGTGTLTYTADATNTPTFSGLTGASSVNDSVVVEMTVRYVYCRPLSTLIGDYVWEDTNQDGIQDANELGVAGVTVTLYDSINRIVATTRTDAFGKYYFNDVAAGKYAVGVTLPVDYSFTSANASADDEKDSDINPFTGKTAFFTIALGDTNLTVDAGIYFARPINANLGDFVWYDTNNNGIQDANEDGVSNITVNLIDATNNNLVATTITNAQGRYGFSNLPAGSYYIRITLPVGYTYTTGNVGSDNAIDSDIEPITGNSETVNLLAGTTNLTLDAGLVVAADTTASLGDFVWNDLNQNGVQDAGEPGVANIFVTLLRGNGTTVATTITDAFGGYIFTNLLPDHYKVRFNVPADYTVSPRNADSNDGIDSDIDATGTTDVFDLFAGDRNLTIDAGIYQTVPAGTAAIGDYVWFDENQDGRQDANEVGVPGVIVTLLDNATSSILATTTTNTVGFYKFVNLDAGNYKVRFSNLPPATQFTDKGVGSPDTDSDADPATGLSSIINLSIAEYDSTIDAGIKPNQNLNGMASLGDFVWNDLNNNGIQEAGEPGVGNVTATLYNIAGTPIDTTTTDATGHYLFNGLQAGRYYVIFSAIPTDYSIVSNNQGGDDNLDSDADPITGITPIVALTTGENNLSIDAGIFNPTATASIGDFVWNDQNQNGVQDPSEVGVPGISVTLYNNAGQAIRTTVTDENGFYLFPSLSAGTYTVGFNNLPPTFQFSQPDQGGDDNLDSDANAAGQTPAITLTNGQVVDNIDAGIFSATTAAIGNKVWYDTNKNGIQDANELGVAGVRVLLLNNVGAPISSAITDANGEYYFVNIAPGSYSVQFTNLPQDAVFTSANVGGDDAIDSDADTLTGKTPVFSVAAGDINYTFDAGIYVPRVGAVTGIVWFDANKDGIRDASELPVAGVTVALIQNGVIISTTVTGNDGVYNFYNVPAGNYTTQFTTLPSGSEFTLPNQGGDDTKDSDVDDITNGLATTPITVVAGTTTAGADAGITIPASLGGVTWIDADQNGIRDTNELPQPNILVSLYRMIGGNPTLVRTGRTNDLGVYLFTGLLPGDYYVIFAPLQGSSFTFANQGGVANDTTDSDANQTTGRAPSNSADVITLNNGDNVRNVDAGYTTSAFPITLLSFEGKMVNVDANLQWVTIKERNSSVFIVERKIGDTGSWSPIGQADALGTSDIEHKYPVFVDINAGLLNTDKLIYRLQMVDIDGTFTPSKEVVLSLLDNPSPIFANVYPNPARTEINVEYMLNNVSYAEVRVVNAVGQVVYSKDVNANTNIEVVKLDVRNWARGCYMVQIVSEETTKSFKVIVE